jgi:DNA-binding MarR family transcriptional regulator
MSPNELAALVVLRDASYSSSELSLKIAADMRTTERAVDRLAQRGFVVREAASVHITDAGRHRVGR